MPSSWVSSTLLTGLEILPLSSFQSFSNNPFILLVHLMDLFPLFFFPPRMKKPRLSFSDHPKVLTYSKILYNSLFPSSSVLSPLPFAHMPKLSHSSNEIASHTCRGPSNAICLFSFWLLWVFVVFARAFSSCSEQGLSSLSAGFLLSTGFRCKGFSSRSMCGLGSCGTGA